MQLATEPCRPNEEDPWSCMESIQLAPDPCPLNDPDPWSCMEHIQLATYTSPPNADDPDPWSCMETIQFATDPFPPNAEDRWNCIEPMQLATDPSASNADDPDPWNCMETIQLEQAGTHSPPPFSSDPGNDMPALDRTKWIPWIDRNKHILRACTTQPWFLQLTADWKQYLREHIAANDASGEHRKAATMHRKKLDLWKQWVAQQHRHMSMYGQEAWFQHLLNSVQQETVPQTGEVPGVEKQLEVEKVMGTADTLRVTHAPRSQLHHAPHMTKPVTAKIWILLLAFVIEQCELERSLQEKELYVDDLLEKL
ncbi:hypothetical protein AK88_04622 [Plasmodium fragile]|uniref:Schizont-infected cell agglutination C-terminal domain-containing protein n=1 Tax=Plasmodium fragile TaxID=5857 RepID=A0A0D9QG18_PLAFR|nr:uncharacterized protein AK88_04622 [Plasmodium fragile]KJP85752.1 hypothetical protein AK88_04622 [Plasmodium fragile]